MFLFGSALIRIRLGSWKVLCLNCALKTKFKAFGRENEPLFSVEAPAGYPNTNSNNRKIESARGTMGRGKNLACSLSPSHCPPCAFFFPFLQPPYDTKRPLRRRERMSYFWGCKSVRYFQCIQTQGWLKWIAEVSSWGIALWFLRGKCIYASSFSLNKFGSISSCLVGDFLQSILVLRWLHLRSHDATATRGIILYVSHKGMLRPKLYGFCAVLVWKWV